MFHIAKNIQACFVPSLDDIRPFVLMTGEEDLKKIPQCIFAVSLLTSLERDVILHFRKLEFPLSKDVMCKVCLTLASGSGEDVEDELMDDGQQTISKAHLIFSSGEL